MGIIAFPASLIVMGLSGIVAQILLLRELLVSFLGNELTLGIILANWLVLEGIGSFVIGKSVEKATRKIELYVLLQLLFSVSLPACIYLSRVLKNILVATPGEAVGFGPIYYASFLILLPVALPHGALFTYGCRNYSLRLGEDASSIGRVYVLETVGSIAGGVLLTFFLIQHFHSFGIAIAVSLTNAVVSVFLLLPGPERVFDRFRKGLFGISILLTLIFVIVIATPLSEEISSAAIRKQWKGIKVLHNENSIYGNLTVTKRGEQYTFFSDGIPHITTPVPDIAGIEDFVHFSMLFHQGPESVMVLSGGAGGMIREILKYPVKRVDYVELDPLLLMLIERYSTSLTRSELSDKRVRVHYTDGRFFLKRVPDRYDVIFIGLDAPMELQTNRLFTVEFFKSAKEKMSQDGIISLTLPGSLTYLSPELRDLNRCILDTLSSVFWCVRVIPGEVNLYFASNSRSLSSVTASEMVKRLDERNIKASLITGAYIKYRLDERWLTWFTQSMEKGSVRINSDFRPLGVFFSLSYWNALFSPSLLRIFRWLSGASIGWIAGVIAAVTFCTGVIFLFRPRFSRHAISYSIFTTGFGGMIFDLAIIFTFQTLYGYLYYQIGLLITVFMGGVALSSHWITRHLDRIQRGRSLFLLTEVSLVCFALLLPFVFLFPSRFLEKQAVYVLLYALFLTMSFTSGALIGFQFPLATDIHLKERDHRYGPSNGKRIGRTAGALYSADLFGGFCGGIMGGVFLLPVLGLKESCFILAAFKGSSLVLFFLFMKSHLEK